jgi:hypothetical protein
MQLTIDRVRQLGGAAGIAFLILGAVSLFLPGTPPKANEVAKITPYLVDKRGSILASDFLLGLAFMLFLLFLGALRTHLGATAEREGVRPGATALAGGVAATVLVLAGTAVTNGAAFQVAGAGDIPLNHALYDVANDLFFLSGFGFAAFFIGAGLAGASTGALPGALASTAYVVALLNILGAIGLFAKSGFFAIGGAFGYIVPLASLLWILAVCIMLLRPASAERVK